MITTKILFYGYFLPVTRKKRWKCYKFYLFCSEYQLIIGLNILCWSGNYWNSVKLWLLVHDIYPLEDDQERGESNPGEQEYLQHQLSHHHRANQQILGSQNR